MSAFHELNRGLKQIEIFLVLSRMARLICIHSLVLTIPPG